MECLERESGLGRYSSSGFLRDLGLGGCEYGSNIGRTPLDIMLACTLELSGIVKEFERILERADDIVSSSIGCLKKKIEVERTVGASLPGYVLLPALGVADFFEKRRGAKYIYLAKSLGVSNFKQRVSSDKGSMIEVATIKLLASDGGIKLAKHIGAENICFKYGCSLVQAFEKAQKLRRNGRDGLSTWG